MADPTEKHRETESGNTSSKGDSKAERENEANSSGKWRVLTKSLIPTITQGLDAGDVLECYTLLRSIPLHGMANSTIHVQKQVLGFRYRPLGGKGTAMLKKPVEVTLEYGPQKFGTELESDGTPLTQVLDGSAILTWDNEARIYYTTKIVSDRYVSSYYMASMTGTVLGKTLAKAVEFAEQRRKYQPFSVYSPDNEKILKSSSNQDFTNFIWKELAYLGVEIEPILPPPMYEPRLWATTINKIIPEGQVAYDAAMFYSQLYKCLTAIASNDYSPYTPTEKPSLSAAPSFMPTTSSAPSVSPKGEQISVAPNNSTSTDNGTGAPTSLANANNRTSHQPPHAKVHTNATNSASHEFGHGAEPIAEDGESEANEDSEGDNAESIAQDEEGNKDGAGEEELENEKDGDKDENDVSDSVPGNHTRRRRMDAELEQTSSTVGDLENDDFEVIDGEDDEELDGDSYQPSIQPSDSMLPSRFPSLPPTIEPLDSDEEAVADALKSANDAAEKAETALLTQTAMDGLLSGDGDSMTAVITANCLTDPRYGIASLDEDGNISASVYLYRDGSLFWHLDLVEPYFTVERINRPLPKAADISTEGGGGDLVDWTLALLVMGTVFIGILLIIQQMNIKILHRLYHLQRWFFNPTEHDYEGDMLVAKTNELGEDGVPVAMGGRRTLGTTYRDSPPSRGNSSVRRDPSEASSFDRDDDCKPNPDVATGDVEMRDLSTKPRSYGRSGSIESIGMNNTNMSITSSGSEEFDSSTAIMMAKNPAMVDLPSLSSSSKIATPVGMANGTKRIPDFLDLET